MCRNATRKANRATNVIANLGRANLRPELLRGRGVFFHEDQGSRNEEAATGRFWGEVATSPKRGPGLRLNSCA